MTVTCPGCRKRFDDENDWCLCSHNPLDVDPDATVPAGKGFGPPTTELLEGKVPVPKGLDAPHGSGHIGSWDDKKLTWRIYVLMNPRTRVVRYVGCTTRALQSRLRAHICESMKSQKTHKSRWIMSLLRSGLSPQLEVIETGSGDGWQDAERRWISYYRSIGANLANGTDGGDGTPGWGTPEQRREAARKGAASRSFEERSASARMGQAARTFEAKQASRKKAIETSRAVGTLAMANKWASMSPEQRSSVNKKTWASTTLKQRAQFGARVSAAISEEERERRRRAILGRWAKLTPEQRSLRAKARWAEVPAEQRSLYARKREADKTAEKRSADAKKTWASRSPETRGAAAKQFQASRTPEQRSASARKREANKKVKKLSVASATQKGS
jgi:hypothetical protein